jgi:hypothetical protein
MYFWQYLPLYMKMLEKINNILKYAVPKTKCYTQKKHESTLLLSDKTVLEWWYMTVSTVTIRPFMFHILFYQLSPKPITAAEVPQTSLFFYKNLIIYFQQKSKTWNTFYLCETSLPNNMKMGKIAFMLSHLKQLKNSSNKTEC